MHLLLIFTLVGLLGTGVVFLKVQGGTIQSRKIVVGASLLLGVSGIALAVVAVQDSAVRAQSIDRPGFK
jgi:hypothetical protein